MAVKKMEAALKCEHVNTREHVYPKRENGFFVDMQTKLGSYEPAGNTTHNFALSLSLGWGTKVPVRTVGAGARPFHFDAGSRVISLPLLSRSS